MDLEKLKDYQKHIRNFAIVAHIDHGKSTIADRILELTDTVSQRQLKNQMLDDMPLERQRGITIKMNSVEVKYHAKDGEDYIFHLIDTPGHVDFSYEVSRSLAACEGALMVVDASQGVQAQTLANTYVAIDDDLEILPVINKIDLPSADIPKTKEEIEEMLGLDASEAAEVSGKTGQGIEDMLEKVVKDIPAPSGDITAPLKALIFDSKYDDYRGVVMSVKIEDGVVKPGDRIKIMNTGKEYEVTEVGVSSPHPVKKDLLIAGDVGYITANIKSVRETRVGDTITDATNPTEEPLEGYRQIPPMVYSGM